VCLRPCSSCWSFHLLREEFLSAPIHSPLSGSPYRSFSCIIHDFIYPFQGKIVLLACLVHICEVYAHSPFSIFLLYWYSVVQLDWILHFSDHFRILKPLHFSFHRFYLFLGHFPKFMLFRHYFSSVSRVCSMVSLLTPCKSLADQAKTSLFLFKN
jgi:hypothetical protein